MTQDRIYILDGAAHVREGVDVDAEDDRSAIAKAREAGELERIELWRLDRFACGFRPIQPSGNDGA